MDTMRRAPVQERSAARVERMLDVCGRLIDDVGYEATTTTMIAKRAEVSVGSLYQFFPDKRAVVQALAQRNLDTYLARLGQALAERRLVALRLFGLVRAMFGVELSAEEQLVVVVLIKAADAVTKYAFRSPEGDPQVMDELKVLMNAYLGARLDTGT